MAITFQRLTVLSRSSGRSAVAATAYVMRASIRDERTGTLHTYTRARDVDADSVSVVGWQGSAGELANAMEMAEKRKDARTARLVVVALPHELTPEQQRAALTEYSQALHEIAQTPVISVRHSKGDNENDHAHLIVATRSSEDGLTLSSKKARIWDDQKTGPETCVQARQLWIDIGNRHLVLAGHPASLSFSAPEGVIPKEHLGPGQAALEGKGVATTGGNRNRERQAQQDELAARATARASLVAMAREAQVVEAAAIVAAPTKPTAAPPALPLSASTRPQTAPPEPRTTPSGVPVREQSSGPQRLSTALKQAPQASDRGHSNSLQQTKLDEVPTWWPVILGTRPGFKDPEERAKWLDPRVIETVREHGADKVQEALEASMGRNRRAEWLTWKGVAERLKKASKLAPELWAKLTRSPPDLHVPPPLKPSHDQPRQR